jgi:hypothetical protein
MDQIAPIPMLRGKFGDLERRCLSYALEENVGACVNYARGSGLDDNGPHVIVDEAARQASDLVIIL